ncbi:hypothetical protein WIA03_24135, partial [Enterobacter hormaechei]|uniref:hypothetical protein n=1 Tax=Enterobacter hormaechei TaxID=158836 RepID=UPI00339CD858
KDLAVSIFFSIFSLITDYLAVVNGFQFAGNIRRKGIPCGTSGNLKQEKQKNHTSHKFTLLSVHEHL